VWRGTKFSPHGGPELRERNKKKEEEEEEEKKEKEEKKEEERKSGRRNGRRRLESHYLLQRHVPNDLRPPTRPSSRIYQLPTVPSWGPSHQHMDLCRTFKI
jgi:hypothetical protein